MCRAREPWLLKTRERIECPEKNPSASLSMLPLYGRRNHESRTVTAQRCVCPTSTPATVDTGKVGRGTCCAVAWSGKWWWFGSDPNMGPKASPAPLPPGLEVRCRSGSHRPHCLRRGGSPWSGVRHGCPSHSLRAYVGVPVSGTCCIVRGQENVGGGESCKWRGCTRASKRASSRRGYQSPPSVPRQTPSTASDVPHTPGIGRLINATCKGGVPTLKCNVTSKSMVSEMTIEYISTECTHETLVHPHLSVHHRRNIGVEPHLSWPHHFHLDVEIETCSTCEPNHVAEKLAVIPDAPSSTPSTAACHETNAMLHSSPSGITMTRSQLAGCVTTRKRQ